MIAPLLPLVEVHNASEEQVRLLGRMPRMGISALILNAPHVAEAVLGLGTVTMSPDAICIPAALREAVAIRAGHISGHAYVEAQHRRMAGLIGMRPEIIEACAIGSQAAQLPVEWRAPFRLVEAALAGKAAFAEDVNQVASNYGRDGVIGLLVVAGFFSMLGMIATSLSLPIDPLPEAT